MSAQAPAPQGSKGWLPQTEWIMEYHQRTPYNESEIVSLITEIIKLLLIFGYHAAHRIDWAPPGGHAINETLCTELNLAPAVVSLLKRLPYADEDFESGKIRDFHLFPCSPYYNYRRDDLLRVSRTAEEKGRHTLEPWDIALTVGFNEGSDVILDTRDSTIHHSSNLLDAYDFCRCVLPHR